MSLDIHTAVQTAIILAILGIFICIWSGIRSIRRASSLRFFRMRRDHMIRGWRLIFFALFLVVVAFILYRFAEPVAYSFFPPTPTITLTPTITVTPSITTTPTTTLTPTITPTPSISDTPTFTPTPQIPLAIETRFESTVTPNPNAVFSDLIFSQGIDEDSYQPLNPGTEFQNPMGHMYALFSYDGMAPESQWTALWYRGNDLVFYETKPWDGGTGGFGFTDWDPEPHEWWAGEYEVQIFTGNIWKVSGRFLVEGEAPTPIPSITPTVTETSSPTITKSPTSTLSPTSTNTQIPTATSAPPTATLTRQPSSTPTITLPPRETSTSAPPTITLTRRPYASPTTMTPTITRRPTHTLTITPTPTRTFTPAAPSATITRQPTHTRTITLTSTQTFTPVTPSPTYTRQPYASTMTPTSTLIPTSTRTPFP